MCCRSRRLTDAVAAGGVGRNGRRKLVLASFAVEMVSRDRNSEAA